MFWSVCALVASAGAASAQDHCSRDSFAVDGSPVAVSLCVEDGSTSPVAVTATFSRGSSSFSRSLPVTVVAGATVSRAVEEVALDPLGVGKRLHLTIAYRQGRAVVEHAMLLPGAIVLK